MKTAKISLTDSDGTIIRSWEVQDVKGLTAAEQDNACPEDQSSELLLYDSSKNEFNAEWEVGYMEDIQFELQQFFTQQEK